MEGEKDISEKPIEEEKKLEGTNGDPSKDEPLKEELPVEGEKQEEEKEPEPVEMVEIPKTRLEELETVEARALEEVKLERASAINYRKRLEKQRDEFAEVASVRVLKKVLNIKDDIQRILDNGKETIPKEHLEGIDLLRQRVDGIFDQENVTLIKIKEGKTAYDPYKHEAILTVPVEDKNPNIILTLVNAGFVKGDRVIRPAKVIISVRPPKPKEEEVKEEKHEVKEEASHEEAPQGEEKEE
ncbi:MAG: nucleotide exchange factor GrpE [Candidatus Kariarchaeaceae archaeon]|jgi:molecular chaperone GrpE